MKTYVLLVLLDFQYGEEVYVRLKASAIGFMHQPTVLIAGIRPHSIASLYSIFNNKCVDLLLLLLLYFFLLSLAQNFRSAIQTVMQ